MLPADFVKVAEACGLKGIRIDDAGRCKEQLEEALNIDGPVLIECVVDPNEPALESPLPDEHAENYFKALKKTTKGKAEIAEELLDNLKHEEKLVPQAINEVSKKLIDELRAKNI